MDCFSRRLVGWSIADHMRTSLVADALRAAAATRGSLVGAVFHSDHEAQPSTPLANSPMFAPSWGCGSPWVRSVRMWTTHSPSRSTRPSNARRSVAPAACRRTRERPHPRTDERGQFLMR
ncbi:hypothetical protein C1I97_35965 [Streptomyces sp. NTH33]|nr:hypothetical protein C1I97_35965 [Streptomyces sp. NTH33]